MLTCAIGDVTHVGGCCSWYSKPPASAHGMLCILTCDETPQLLVIVEMVEDTYNGVANSYVREGLVVTIYVSGFVTNLQLIHPLLITLLVCVRDNYWLPMFPLLVWCVTVFIMLIGSGC